MGIYWAIERELKAIGDTAVEGKYQDKPAWSNHYFVEFGVGVPSEWIIERRYYNFDKLVDDIYADVLAGELIEAIPMCGKEVDYLVAEGRDIVHFKPIFRVYFQYIYAEGIKFYISKPGKPIVVRNLGGDLIGLIMPLFYSSKVELFRE